MQPPSSPFPNRQSLTFALTPATPFFLSHPVPHLFFLKGVVAPADVASLLTPDTALVTIMHSNNEVSPFIISLPSLSLYPAYFSIKSVTLLPSCIRCLCISYLSFLSSSYASFTPVFLFSSLPHYLRIPSC
jgi:hypothetical protein